jgi:biopolymer transport protein TolR
MGAALSGQANRQQPSPDINITPLVDVCLVLLIIFMVIAPALSEGAMLELPKVTTVDERPKEANPLEVTIAADGTLIVDKEKINEVDLKTKVAAAHAADPQRSLLLKMDHNAPYKKVRETFALLADVGFKGVLLKVVEKKTGS